MGVGVLPAQVVGVVRGDGQGSGLRGQLRQTRQDGLLVRKPVVHQLDEEPVPPDQVVVEAHDLPGSALVSRQHPLGDFAPEACRSYGEPPAVPGEDFPVYSGLEVEALEVPDRGEPAQVPVSFLVHGEEGQVVVSGAPAARIAFGDRRRGDVGLHADDGPEVTLHQFVMELDRAEEAAVIGDGASPHAGFHEQIGQLGGLHRPVEEAVLGVQVKVVEIAPGRHYLSPQASSPPTRDDSVEPSAEGQVCPYCLSNSARSS